MDEVNETSIDLLLRSGLVIRDDLVWKRRDPTERRIRMEVSVANGLGEPLKLYMHVPLRIPWQYSLALVWRKVPIRRLDVRASHVNQCDASGERWVNQTHKHKWRDAYRDGWAYTPSDIPDTSKIGVGANEHQEVFEAFCSECSIQIASNWVGPDLNGPLQDTIGGGE